MNKCKCGCGLIPKTQSTNNSQYCKGHWMRTSNARQALSRRSIGNQYGRLNKGKPCPALLGNKNALGSKARLGQHNTKEHNEKVSRARILYYKTHPLELQECIARLRHLSELNKGRPSPMKGKHHKDETKEKIRMQLLGNKNGINAFKGKHHHKEWKQRMSDLLKGERNPFYGKHHTLQARKKISDRMQGERNPLYGKHHTEETKNKISVARKGSKVSEETKLKMGMSHKGKYIGSKHPMYGKHLTLETRKLISIALSGDKNPMFGKKVKCQQLRFVPELNHSVRSSWEEEVCKFLMDNNIPYEYEPIRVYTKSNPRLSWTPDIRIGDVYIEVKGFLKDYNKDKYTRCINENGMKVICIVSYASYKSALALPAYIIKYSDFKTRLIEALKLSQFKKIQGGGYA